MINIDDIKRRMLVKYPLFGSIVANLKYIEDKSCGTAGTDGKNIYYNPNFIEGLSEDEQNFIFAHEVCHVAFDHIFRSEGKDKELWNIATDAVINALLQQDGLQMVKGGVDIPEAVNYNAEEMYKKLLDKKQEEQNQAENQGQKGQAKTDKTQGESKQQGQNGKLNENQNKQQSQGEDKKQATIENEGQEQKQELEKNSDQNQSGQQNQNKDVGHDTHSLWDKAIEEKKQKEKKKQENQGGDSKKESLLDKLLNKKNKTESSETKEEQKDQETDEEKQMKEAIKKLTEIGEKKSFSQNKIERKKQIEELMEQLAKQSIGAGNSTNSISRKINGIGTSTPLIDWRKLLKEAVKVDVDWSYKNASIDEGVVTPHLEEIPKPETEIVLDTSGSINEILLRNFLRECKNILQNSKVKVGCFDTKFYGFQEIRNVNDIDNIQFQGGGGTNFNSAVNAFSRRVENKIIFTDGDAPMPDKTIDAIWIVFGGSKINPKGGRVINITNEQLQKLYNYISDNEKDR